MESHRPPTENTEQVGSNMGYQGTIGNDLTVFFDPETIGIDTNIINLFWLGDDIWPIVKVEVKVI